MDVPSKRNPILTHGSSTMRKRFFESPPHWSWSRVEIIRSGFNCQAKTSPSLYGNTPHKSPDLSASYGNFQSFYGQFRQHSINPNDSQNPHCTCEQFFGHIG